MHNCELSKSNIAISEDTKLFRYAIVIEYDGSNYAGSQKQTKYFRKSTIQSEVEKALHVLAKDDVKAIFSGRNDSGVHSKGQVAHFDLPFEVDVNKFIYSLNGLLPDDITVSYMNVVNDTFHSQKSAMFRWYRYIINNKHQRSVWFKNSMHIQVKLDVKSMNNALKHLVGTHDFSSFKSANSCSPVTECTMYYAECSDNDGIIYIDVVANRFLYNMVRIIVGTLIEIGKGVYNSDFMLELIKLKDRTKAGPTAKPNGLFYMLVGYTLNSQSNVINEISNYLKREINKDENIFSKA